MSDSYTVIASYYDLFNSADYDAFCDFYESAMVRYGKQSRGLPKERLLLDLACGTGSVALRMAKRGFEVIGIDLSEDMLSLAHQNADAQALRTPVLWLRQDMRRFELYGTVEVAVCALDSLNYLTKAEDLERTFACVHNYLEPNGLFLFDLRTPHCLAALGERDFVSEAEGVVFQWQNDYHPSNQTCDFYISFFAEQEDGSYRRFSERQRERAYSDRTVCRLLKAQGFEILTVCGDPQGSAPTDTDDRHFFVCRCIK